EHVDGGLAGVEVGVGVCEEFDELGDRWYVDLLHLPFHHPCGEAGEAGEGAEQGWEVQAGVADGGDLDLLDAVCADRVEAEEGEEEVCLDAFHAGAIGHDETWVDT